jgi:hypothetical protein
MASTSWQKANSQNYGISMRESCHLKRNRSGAGKRRRSVIRLKDLFKPETWVGPRATVTKWAKRGLIIVVVIVVIWGVVKVVPLDILRGDSGYLLIEGFGEPPIETRRLQVKGDDLRIYEFRLLSNPKMLCASIHGNFGAWGDCEYDPDYVVPVDPTSETAPVEGRITTDGEVIYEQKP